MISVCIVFSLSYSQIRFYFVSCVTGACVSILLLAVINGRHILQDHFPKTSLTWGYKKTIPAEGEQMNNRMHLPQITVGSNWTKMFVLCNIVSNEYLATGREIGYYIPTGNKSSFCVLVNSSPCYGPLFWSAPLSWLPSSFTCIGIWIGLHRLICDNI